MTSIVQLDLICWGFYTITSCSDSEPKFCIVMKYDWAFFPNVWNDGSWRFSSVTVPFNGTPKIQTQVDHPSCTLIPCSVHLLFAHIDGTEISATVLVDELRDYSGTSTICATVAFIGYCKLHLWLWHLSELKCLKLHKSHVWTGSECHKRRSRVNIICCIKQAIS